MLYVEANQMSYERDGRKIVNISKLKFYEGDNIGLVGPNGCGKSTLLKLLAGELVCDLGHLKINGTCEYIPQLEVLDAETITSKTLNNIKVMHTDTMCMSGGEQTRVKIGKILESYVHFLLIDEPTSSLDEEGIEQFKAQLKRLEHSYILVSHNREVLDTLCNKIWEMREGDIVEYVGNYSEYLNAKACEKQYQIEAYETYVKTKHTLEQTKKDKMKKAAKVTKKNQKTSQKDYGAKSLASATRSYQTKEKKLHQASKAVQSRIDRLEVKEKVKEAKKVDFYIPQRLCLNATYAVLGRQLYKTVGDSRSLLQDAQFNLVTREKTALVGGNGIGKTTLFEMILHQESGILHAPKVKIGYFNQKINQLDEEKSILENVKVSSVYQEGKIRTFLGQMLFTGRQVHKPVKVLSGGEKVKVALAKLFLSDFNVILLDEPTNYLDLPTIKVLEQTMIEYPGTILFTSHDKRLVEQVADSILEIKNQQIIKVK